MHSRISKLWAVPYFTACLESKSTDHSVAVTSAAAVTCAIDSRIVRRPDLWVPRPRTTLVTHDFEVFEEARG